jgi:uncharacterized membrane-anchored protein
MNRVRGVASFRLFGAVIAALLCLSARDAVAQSDSLFERIEWVDGPSEANIGSNAKMMVPEGCRFTGKAGARLFMELTQNPPNDQNEGVLLCPAANPSEDPWFVVFSYDPSGYVRDDESAKLDADKILGVLRKGTEASNKERRSRGWSTLSIDGWVRPPFYDTATHNLTWSMKATSEGVAVVNHSVRLLGRSGVLQANLVIGPEQLETAVPAFDAVINETSFLTGHTYAEWREGDKIAAYGLTALVAGGVAAKFGLLGKLWKLIAVGAAGVLAWIRSLFGRKKEPAAPAPMAARPVGSR